jgi:hypothetical protein
MTLSPLNYFQTLAGEFGRGWNRFWFAPSDPLTLGLLRIASGLMAFYLVASYSPDLERYFGSNGLVPLEMVRGLEAQTRDGDRQVLPGQVREAMPREYRFSYLDYFHTPGGLRTVHACGLLTLALFTCGLFTRLTGIASLVVVLSYLHRGPMLTSQVEPILAFVLFYLCLGPAGAACSLDRRWAARREGLPVPASSLASPWATVSLRLIQVHLTVVYLMMAVGKLGGNIWWSGLAMWFLIARSEQRMVDLTALSSLPLLVHAGSYAVMFWQAAFPILIWNRLARPLLLGINALMWALLAPVIGNIPLAVMMVVASLAFVPGDVLRKVTAGPAGRSGDYQAALKANAAA